MIQPVQSKPTVLSGRQVVWLTLTLAIAMDTVVHIREHDLEMSQDVL